MAFNVIAPRTRRAFCEGHPDALDAMETWYHLLSRSGVTNTDSE
ncbi:hypothetical protein [Deinococcus marmoris]|uniref:Uncharacterized protein n=1 Tax=Deinococcus marmoris TaxID=249408 RepID=A0A1U7P395_9DEIO|nr:hypothetical protein [Deinococcus marmoris]OLV19629.1 hypothetical protein BOO71_0002260 [Deinococcus marmoris]